LGLSQKESAKSMIVDQSTLARWERGEREPTGTFLTRVVRFIGEAETGRERG
jgi:transcriptional regulator with XRE-family HTH domain